MSEEHSQAIDDLQARVSFQEDTIATLNDQVATMGQEIQDLQKQLHLVYKKLDDVVYQMEQGQNTPSNMVDEKPPHY